MTIAGKSKRVWIGCSLALLTMAGCQGGPGDPGSPGGPDSPGPAPSAAKPVMFPQTSETIVLDPANAPAAGATVVRVYDDELFGKTEVRSDHYLRHADPVSPSGWTPWHFR